MTSHNRKWKEDKLSAIQALIREYPVIAVADINMFPASLFQALRKKMHGKSVIVVSKTRVLRRALESNRKTAELAPYATKNCAAIFTKMNPFELFGFLKKNKGKMPAKIGAIAEEDIIVPAGDTGLPPGPALSDLKGAGLKVGVQGSTIAIMEEKIVTKAGQEITAPVAGTLSKLNIKPFKVGMKLVAALEADNVFKSSVLDIDIDKIFLDFIDAQRKAFNLAFNAAIPNSATTELLLAKAFLNAKAVSIEGKILNSTTINELLAKADLQAKGLKSMVKDAPPESTASEASQVPSKTGQSLPTGERVAPAENGVEKTE